MERILFLLSLILIGGGLVGVVRGCIDRRWITSRQASLFPLALGVGLLFFTTAPPTNASGSVGRNVQPPPTARTVLLSLEPVVKAGTEPTPHVLPDQKRSYPHWERQLLEAHKAADDMLSQVAEVMQALDEGRIDRFTAWARLGVLAEGVRQANLSVHDLTPPSLFDLRDRHTLEEALADLKSSLDTKRKGIQELQAFARTTDPAHLVNAQIQMDRGHEHMVAGLTKVLQVKARLSAESE